MTISGSASVSHPENDTGVIGAYSVPAASGTITCEQDGDDSGGPGYTKFSISDAGELSFTYPLDYENPRDCDGDNVYEVTLWAFERSDVVALLDVSATVTDVYETQTGPPAITGTAQVGKTLAASTSAIRDTDGLENVSYSYQWLADDMDIDGETRSTYTVRIADAVKIIKVQVSFTDDAGHQESLTSAGTSAVVMGGL